MIIKIDNKEIKIEYINDGKTILDILRDNSIFINVPCNAKHTCGKCLVFVNGIIKKACSTIPNNNDYITVLDTINEYSIIYKDVKIKNKMSIVLDMGTTTLSYALLSDEIVEIDNYLNPEKTYGEDVISRVEYSIEHTTNNLFKSINELTSNVIKKFIEIYKCEIDTLIVSGNTIMLHTFINEDISGFSKYPFNPKFLDLKEFKGEELNLSVNKIILIPSLSPFVGGDIVSGIIDQELYNKNNILIDLGTNGEIAAFINKKLYITSVACGPAFEGKNIKCGMTAINGAINKIEYVNDEFKYNVIGNVKPIGFTGSAIIDLISILYNKLNIIDSFGTFKNGLKEYRFNSDLYITQEDIRNIESAKAAVRGGLQTLLKNANVSYDDIDNIYIAGGFGSYLNIDNASSINMFNVNYKYKIKSVGNTSLNGAIKILKDIKLLDKINEFKKDLVLVDLSANRDFFEYFIEYMNLGDE